MNAALGLLDSGRLPPEVPLAEICRQSGMTEESFHSQFRDAGQLYAATAEKWLDDRITSLPGPAVGAAREPVDTIRMIQAALAGTAARDAAMTRWAATAPAAAAAVAEADRVLTSHLKAALTDLGLAGREPEAVAGVLAGALHAEQESFEVVLGILVRSAAVLPEAPAVETIPGAEPGHPVNFLAPPGGLTEDEQATLTRIARRFAAGRGTEEPLPHRNGKEADGALPVDPGRGCARMPRPRHRGRRAASAGCCRPAQVPLADASGQRSCLPPPGAGHSHQISSPLPRLQVFPNQGPGSTK